MMNKQSDHLARQPFIDLLKKVIVNQTEKKHTYSLAIDGAWGCGKTWVLNELEKQLVEERNSSYLVFLYNTWENDFYEEPLVALLSVMIESLKVLKKKVKEKDSIGKVIESSITSLTKIVGSVIEKRYNINVNEIIDSIKETGSVISNSDLAEADFNKMLPLKNALIQIKEVLQNLAKEKQIILIIDELDRCLPEYAIKVLERLHHICLNNQIISIIALDKNHMADSIAKVYGKNYDYLAGDRTRELLGFANLYLQKFIDISIPLPNGSLSNAIEGLNGLDKKFGSYSYTYVDGKKLVNVDENYLDLFLKKIFDRIDKRTQEKIISLTTLCHELTIAAGTTLEKYGYQILISELLQSINSYIFNKNKQILCTKKSSNQLKLSFGHIASTNDNDVTKNWFEHNIVNLFTANSDINEFIITDTDSYIIQRFVNYNSFPKDSIQVMFLKEIEEEKTFLEKYCDILEKINKENQP